MIIKVDKEGEKVLTDLCDLALRVGGLKNVNAVTQLLNTIEVIKNDTARKDIKKGSKKTK